MSGGSERTFQRQTSSSAVSPLGRPRFLVLEFTQVASIDATAVHSCFVPAARLTATLEVKLVYAGCAKSVESQLRKHGAFAGQHVRIFPTVQRALDWYGTPPPTPTPPATTTSKKIP